MCVASEACLSAHLATDPAAAAEWARDFKLKNDPRITRLGNILRKTSLDELPQLWNVLCGEMSLVGPRPVMHAELEKYGVHKMAYLAVLPGITGLWQVSGRNDVTYAERVDMDVAYARKITLGSDLSILLLTFGAVVKASGK